MSAVTPLRLPAFTLNVGVRSELVEPFDGEEGIGGERTTSASTTKLIAVEYGPVFAPSSALVRHQYVPAASLSGNWKRVTPSVPGSTPERAKTIFLNAASVATSNEYFKGRAPVVSAFLKSSFTGWSRDRSVQSCPGSSRLAVDMTTPSIGPATAGLSGLALLSSWHADRNTAAAIPTRSDLNSLVIDTDLQSPWATGCTEVRGTAFLSKQVVSECSQCRRAGGQRLTSGGCL